MQRNGLAACYFAQVEFGETLRTCELVFSSLFPQEKCFLCIKQHLQQCMQLITILSSLFLYAFLHLLTLQAHAGSIFCCSTVPKCTVTVTEKSLA